MHVRIRTETYRPATASRDLQHPNAKMTAQRHGIYRFHSLENLVWATQEVRTRLRNKGKQLTYPLPGGYVYP